jgi:Alkylmercury lyase
VADIQLLARAYHAVLSGFVRDGRAPHYTEIAVELGMNAEEGRQVQRELLAALSGPLAAQDGRLASLGGAHWSLPDTDYIASFSPFANVATQYRISVNGEQKWYGQCGLESLAVSWLFPRREVRIDARCLDCAEPLTVRMRDGELLEASPETIVGHSNVPLPRFAQNWPRT